MLVTGTIVLFQTWHMLLFSILLNMCSRTHSTQIIVSLVLIKIELNLRDMREKYFFQEVNICKIYYTCQYRAAFDDSNSLNSMM